MSHSLVPYGYPGTVYWAGMLCCLCISLTSISCSAITEARDRASSAETSQRASPMQETRLSLKDSGKTFVLAPGSELFISLSENPSTGYTWAPDMQEGDIVELRESTFVPDADAEPVPGRGGLRIFRFEVLNPGLAEISLKRWRPWNGNDSIVERFEVFVLVKS